MRSKYKRENLTITAFDTEDVITTSGMLPEDPTSPEETIKAYERENAYGSFGSFNRGPGSWF